MDMNSVVNFLYKKRKKTNQQEKDMENNKPAELIKTKTPCTSKNAVERMDEKIDSFNNEVLAKKAVPKIRPDKQSLTDVDTAKSHTNQVPFKERVEKSLQNMEKALSAYDVQNNLLSSNITSVDKGGYAEMMEDEILDAEVEVAGASVPTGESINKTASYQNDDIIRTETFDPKTELMVMTRAQYEQAIKEAVKESFLMSKELHDINRDPLEEFQLTKEMLEVIKKLLSPPDFIVKNYKHEIAQAEAFQGDFVSTAKSVGFSLSEQGKAIKDTVGNCARFISNKFKKSRSSKDKPKLNRDVEKETNNAIHSTKNTEKDDERSRDLGRRPIKVPQRFSPTNVTVKQFQSLRTGTERLILKMSPKERKAKFCVCGVQKGGMMVRCSNYKKCEKQWYHYGNQTACVDYDSVKYKNRRWYCPTCSKNKPNKKLIDKSDSTNSLVTQDSCKETWNSKFTSTKEVHSDQDDSSPHSSLQQNDNIDYQQKTLLEVDEIFTNDIDPPDSPPIHLDHDQLEGEKDENDDFKEYDFCSASKTTYREETMLSSDKRIGDGIVESTMKSTNSSLLKSPKCEYHEELKSQEDKQSIPDTSPVDRRSKTSIYKQVRKNLLSDSENDSQEELNATVSPIQSNYTYSNKQSTPSPSKNDAQGINSFETNSKSRKKPETVNYSTTSGLNPKANLKNKDPNRSHKAKKVLDEDYKEPKLPIQEILEAKGIKDSALNYELPEHIKIQIPYAEWRKVYDPTEPNKLKKEYPKLIDDQFKVLDIPCSFNAHDYYPLSRSRDVFTIRGQCSGRSCLVKFFGKVHAIEENKPVEITITHKGKCNILQSEASGRRLKGFARDEAKNILHNNKAHKIFIESNAESNPLRYLHQNTKYRSTESLKKVKLEALNELHPKKTDLVNDCKEAKKRLQSCKMFATTNVNLKPGFIQRIHLDPFSVSMVSPLQIKCSSLIDTVYMDSTGSVMSLPYVESKRMLLHSLMGRVRNAPDLKTIPIFEFVTNESSTSEISSQLRDHLRQVRFISPHWKPTTVIMDFSFPYIHSSSEVYNNEDLLKYINRCYKYNRDGRIVQKDMTKIQICYAHMFNALSRNLTRNGVPRETKRLAMHSFAKLMETITHEELKTCFSQIITMFGCPKLPRKVLLEYAHDLQTTSLMQPYNEIISNFHLTIKSDEELAENLPIKDKMLQREKSMYFQFFDQRKRTILSIDPNVGQPDIIDNLYYCPTILTTLGETYIPYLPLWSKNGPIFEKLGERVLDTTSRVEQWFSVHKNNFHLRKNMYFPFYAEEHSRVVAGVVNTALQDALKPSKKKKEKSQKKTNEANKQKESKDNENSHDNFSQSGKDVSREGPIKHRLINKEVIDTTSSQDSQEEWSKPQKQRNPVYRNRHLRTYFDSKRNDKIDEEGFILSDKLVKSLRRQLKSENQTPSGTKGCVKTKQSTTKSFTETKSCSPTKSSRKKISFTIKRKPKFNFKKINQKSTRGCSTPIITKENGQLNCETESNLSNSKSKASRRLFHTIDLDTELETGVNSTKLEKIEQDIDYNSSENDSPTYDDNDPSYYRNMNFQVQLLRLKEIKYLFKVEDLFGRESSILSLKDEAWLDDEVVNAYARFLVKKYGGESTEKKLHQSTGLSFVILRQFKNKKYEWNTSLAALPNKSEFNSELGTLYIISHNVNHWFLVTCDFSKMRIRSYDSGSVANIITGKVKREHINLLKITLEEKYGISGKNLTFEEMKVPQQVGKDECGVLALQFLEAILKGEPVNSIDVSKTHEARLQIASNLLNTTFEGKTMLKNRDNDVRLTLSYIKKRETFRALHDKIVEEERSLDRKIYSSTTNSTEKDRGLLLDKQLQHIKNMKMNLISNQSKWILDANLEISD